MTYVKKEEVDLNTFFTSELDISKTCVTMCKEGEHAFRKLSDNEIACTICPTVKIVEDITLYV